MNRTNAETQRKNGDVLSVVPSASLRLCGETDFLIWQLVDSAFPTGGFAHSAGLESAWQNGEIRNRKELGSFVEVSLHQLGHAALPFVMAAHDEPGRFTALDQLCDAFTTNHVANRASRAQGKAFLSIAERVYKTEMATHAFDVTCGHFAPIFGAVLSVLNISRDVVVRMFFFNHLRSILAAAVRLNIIGPIEGQVLQRDLSASCEQVIVRCEMLTLDDIAQTSALIDLWQGTQDRLYSRLFQS